MRRCVVRAFWGTPAVPPSIPPPSHVSPWTKEVRTSVSAPPVELTVSYSDLVSASNTKEIVYAEVYRNKGFSTLRAQMQNGELWDVSLPTMSESPILDRLMANGARVQIQSNQEDPSQYVLLALETMTVVAMIRIFFPRLFGASGGFGNPLEGISKSRTREYGEEENTGVTFADVAGVDNAKQDLQEIIQFLEEPERFSSLGARMPRGVLLVGSPGVGKTLLARAVAGEAKVPFFSCSGSEFLEMYVGVGASRVRDLFQRAAAKAPCIVFIDEIDAIGKKRSADPGMGGNDERDQTINQLLTAMDGFEGNQGVIVLAATNRPDMLDEALLRPGRFDRRVTVEAPDLKGRVAILNIHSRGVPLGDDVDIEYMARDTVGFSGADLQSLVNEAAIYAARERSTQVTRRHFELSMEKILIGEERRTMIIPPEKRRILAVHEAGHALLGLILDGYDIVKKVSIVPRGSAGGVTYFTPRRNDDMMLHTRTYLENQIMVALGGRLAEEIEFGAKHVTTGAYGDLEEVYQMARNMIERFGFGDFGPVSLRLADGIRGDVDDAVIALVQSLYERGRRILMSRKDDLRRITVELLEKESLSEEELRMLVSPFVPEETKSTE